MDTLHSLTTLLAECGEALCHDPLLTLIKFASFAARVKNAILLAQPANHTPDQPPAVLPPLVLILLSRVCQVPGGLAERMWTAVKATVWMMDDGVSRTNEDMFREHGADLGFRS